MTCLPFLYFIITDMINMMEMIDSFKATELAILDKVHPNTVRRNRRRYIPVKFKTWRGKQNLKEYSVRYVRVKDVQEYINKELKLLDGKL